MMHWSVCRRLGLGTAFGCVAVLTGATVTTPAAAQMPWPAKPLKIIVNFAPGGGADTATRHLQQPLSEILGVPVIVENRGGGGGIVGTEATVRSAPDGHTIGMIVSSHASNPALFASMPYDAVRDIKPITILFRATNVWAVHPSSPYKSLAEFVAAAKAKPGQLHVVTSGTGTAQHLGFEQFKIATGIDVTHVPYKGAGPALADLMSGQVQVGILNISGLLPSIKDGRLNGLAVTSGTRSVYAPEIASVAETVAGFDSVEWFAFAAPAGVPDEIIDKLYAAISKAARSPAFTPKVKEMGVDLVLNTPAELRAQIATELVKFKDLVAKAQIKLE